MTTGSVTPCTKWECIDWDSLSPEEKYFARIAPQRTHHTGCHNSHQPGRVNPKRMNGWMDSLAIAQQQLKEESTDER